MRRLLALVAALALIAGACGDDSSGTTLPVTSAPASTTTAAPTTTTRPAPSSTTTTDAPPVTLTPEAEWFTLPAVGDCFQDVFDGDDFDFTVPPQFVDCAQPHQNEVVTITDMGGPEDPWPGDDEAADAAAAICEPELAAFFGGGEPQETAFAAWFWPDEETWDQGVKIVICTASAFDSLVGTAASAGLKAPGHTLVALSQAGTIFDLWLVDAGTGELTVNLTDDDAEERLAQASWAPDSSAIAYAALVDGESDIYLVGTSGEGSIKLFDTDQELDTPSIRPGTALEFAFIAATGDGEFDIYSVNLDTGGVAVQLTTDPDRDSSPRWSPDGTQIVFRGRRAGNSDIYVMDADGSNPTQLTSDPSFEGDPSWSPDGSRILFISDRTGDFDVYTMAVDGSDVVNLTNHPADDEYPTWSPDGEFIAFHSNRHAGTQIWLMRSDGSDQSLLVERSPTGYPAFAPGPLP